MTLQIVKCHFLQVNFNEILYLYKRGRNFTYSFLHFTYFNLTYITNFNEMLIF